MPESNRLVWDAVGEKHYHTGCDRGVIYPVNSNGEYGDGVAWSGLTAVNENPSGADPTDLWADNIKYATLRSAEDFKATIEALMYPNEFAECDGNVEIAKGVRAAQQTRKAFGFAYRNLVGNDTMGTDFGYELHLVYGCTTSPSQKQHQTINDNPNTETMSWEVSTSPVNISTKGMKPTAHLMIRSWEADESKLEALEDILYGGTAKARLPLPDEIVTLMSVA